MRLTSETDGLIINFVGADPVESVTTAENADAVEAVEKSPPLEEPAATVLMILDVPAVTVPEEFAPEPKAVEKDELAETVNWKLILADVSASRAEPVDKRISLVYDIPFLAIAEPVVVDPTEIAIMPLLSAGRAEVAVLAVAVM